MNPMDTFDADLPYCVHEGLNDQMIEWKPQWVSTYREYGVNWDDGVIA